MYTDGLLAENHGRGDPAAAVFDALLGEPTSSGFVPYDAQPWLPNPPPLPTTARHLVYLDVWNREVTHLEEPALVESAVGVETTSRVQTVWQVKVWEPELGNDGDRNLVDAIRVADYMLNALNFILGVHPGRNTASFAVMPSTHRVARTIMASRRRPMPDASE